MKVRMKQHVCKSISETICNNQRTEKNMWTQSGDDLIVGFCTESSQKIYMNESKCQSDDGCYVIIMEHLFNPRAKSYKRAWSSNGLEQWIGLCHQIWHLIL